MSGDHRGLPPGFAALNSPEAADAPVAVREASPGAPTVLSFSAIGKPGQRPGRQFGAALARFDVRGMFVQDPVNAGFHHGVPPLGSAFADVAVALSDQIPTDSRRAGALAASVGAFGAVICGTALHVERIMLFSPRTRITREVLETRMATDPALAPIDTKAVTTDLRRWLLENPHPPIDVHVGSGHALDCREAERLDGVPHVTVTVHPTDVHAVSRWLHEEGLLSEIVGTGLGLPERRSARSDGGRQ